MNLLEKLEAKRKQEAELIVRIEWAMNIVQGKDACHNFNAVDAATKCEHSYFNTMCEALGLANMEAEALTDWDWDEMTEEEQKEYDSREDYLSEAAEKNQEILEKALTALQAKYTALTGKGFKLVTAGDVVKPGAVKFIGETVRVADWVADEIGENRADDLPDSLFDGFGDVVQDAAGNLYMAEKIYTEKRNGEYAVWCRIEVSIDRILSESIRAAGGVSALARRLGVTPQAVQNWRQGIRHPRPAIAEKIRAIAVSAVSST